MPLPLPPHFLAMTESPPAGHPSSPAPPAPRLDQVWRVPYQQRAQEAQAWAQHHDIAPASGDRPRVALLVIDAQNTFCLPEFELFVGGRSGRGALDDSRRLCEFIYRNLGQITEIIPSLDTHRAHQIFHPSFWVDGAGQHPAPATQISQQDVESGRWRLNPRLSQALGAAAHDLHYTRTLAAAGKFPLTIWPYHSMLGGIGHALVSALEEAMFFHSIARAAPTRFELKGSHPLTEHYSILRPEVMTQANGEILEPPNSALINHLLSFDRIVVAGQAKSHCVAWTVMDLLSEIQTRPNAPELASRVDLLEDCMSPVVVPGVVDFTEAAAETFAQFGAAGMVRTTAANWG